MHYAILLCVKGINMQKKENLNIQLEEEQKQEQEYIFIGDPKLQQYYDCSRKNVKSLLISLALFF